MVESLTLKLILQTQVVRQKSTYCDADDNPVSKVAIQGAALATVGNLDEAPKGVDSSQFWSNVFASPDCIILRAMCVLSNEF